jgi:hypothetical protein
MILRFMQDSKFISHLIDAQEKTAVPFTPSHVDALTPDGFYIGAHISGGVQKRPVGYDKATTVHELILTLDATPEQDAEFYKILMAKLGEPYDWESIIGFIVPEHLHLPDHIMCSALQALALRGCNWFQWPLAAPFHLIDPRDLLLVLSGRMEIPMEITT